MVSKCSFLQVDRKLKAHYFYTGRSLFCTLSSFQAPIQVHLGFSVVTQTPGPMSIRLRFILLFCTLLPLSSSIAQEKTRELNTMLLEGIEDWHIPGMTAIVVQNGEVVFSEVYGVAEVDTKTPVDRETLFNMGSTTKAMVAMALGILVDQGKLNWTDRVREYLPEFQLSDPYITEEARVQDLLTHNLGIAGADMLWVMDSVSTAQTLKRFAQAPKAYPLRGGFEYNNLMYATAGEVIHSISGMPWSEFVKKHLFEPLEMERYRCPGF